MQIGWGGLLRQGNCGGVQMLSECLHEIRCVGGVVEAGAGLLV